MKETTESYLNAMVTAPASFSSLQRNATDDAATIAGLKTSLNLGIPLVDYVIKRAKGEINTKKCEPNSDKGRNRANDKGFRNLPRT